jgi:hypothetical protein
MNTSAPCRHIISFRRACLAVCLSTALGAQPPAKTPHVHGPHGLEGWEPTFINKEYKDLGPLSIELVIARHGHVIRRIKGDSLMWNWMFLPDGRRVAYETGPLHFAMTCVLMDIRTGRRIDDFDCWNPTESTKVPAWVDALEHHGLAVPAH